MHPSTCSLSLARNRKRHTDQNHHYRSPQHVPPPYTLTRCVHITDGCHLLIPCADSPLEALRHVGNRLGRFKTFLSRAGCEVGAIGVRATFDSVVLSYRRRFGGPGEWKDEEYPFLEWTPRNYGGRRPWSLCPVRSCGRRVAVLYRGGIFACRHCHQLVYKSQGEQPTTEPCDVFKRFG
jgi:hypothetical protein